MRDTSRLNPVQKLFLFGMTICFFVGTVDAQSNQSAAPSVITQRHVPPENSWRSEARDLATEGDTVSPEVRKARDAYWNRRLPKFTGQGGIAVSHGSALSPFTGTPHEFTAITKYLWIIGRFESFHVYQTSGRGGLYTEMNVRVQHVFDVHHPSVLSDGELIDVAIPGGAAIGNDGSRIQFLDDDNVPHIQPGHTYLMEVIPCQQVMPCKNGNFYFPARKWDLTSGTVQPVNDFDLRFTATGKSRIAGTPASTIIPRFQAIIDQSVQGGAK